MRTCDLWATRIAKAMLQSTSMEYQPRAHTSACVTRGEAGPPIMGPASLEGEDRTSLGNDTLRREKPGGVKTAVDRSVTLS